MSKWFVNFVDTANDQEGRFPPTGYQTPEEALLGACPFLDQPDTPLSDVTVTGPDGQRIPVEEVRRFCRSHAVRANWLRVC